MRWLARARAPASELTRARRYRPRAMDEVAFQEEAVRTLQNAVESGNVRLAPPSRQRARG